jgi:hypothetical protein
VASLGEVDVAEDPVRRGKEPTGYGSGEARERAFVAALCRYQEIGVHALFR